MWIDKVENPFVNNRFEFDVMMEEIRFERGFARYNIVMIFRLLLMIFTFAFRETFIFQPITIWQV